MKMKGVQIDSEFTLSMTGSCLDYTIRVEV